jgi:hypothetical protein
MKLWKVLARVRPTAGRADEEAPDLILVRPLEHRGPESRSQILR